jgi:hypothetical protein
MPGRVRPASLHGSYGSYGSCRPCRPGGCPAVAEAARPGGGHKSAKLGPEAPIMGLNWLMVRLWVDSAVWMGHSLR